MVKWREGLPEKKAWKLFKEYVDGYNYAKKDFSAPIPAGINIRGFDLKIYNYLNEKHKIKPFFSRRDVIDILDFCLCWFSFSPDAPPNYKFDTLRDFFGMGTKGAHEAIIDVRQESEVICHFLKTHKKFGEKINWRNSLATGA